MILSTKAVDVAKQIDINYTNSQGNIDQWASFGTEESLAISLESLSP